MTHSDEYWMHRALELARQGEGAVEPNPMVGCVLVRDDLLLGEGYHQRFGGPHAEVAALANSSASDLRGATAYVTLEPCSHFGKTPPCADALVSAEIARVVVAMEDPFPQVSGQGIHRLREADITVDVGVLRATAEALNAPYLMRVRNGRPWVIAKWAMTLDGKIATHAGDSRWISNEISRERVHQLRERMDAIIVGSQTAIDDDPLLTPRPQDPQFDHPPRQPLRIVCDRRLRLPLDAQLAATAGEQPVLIATAPNADRKRMEQLEQAGCEVLVIDGEGEFLSVLLQNLGGRDMTNVLVEGGAGLLGALFDQQLIDEVWTFIAPKIVGGRDAISPIGGEGKSLMNQAVALTNVERELLGDDVLMKGRCDRGKMDPGT